MIKAYKVSVRPEVVLLETDYLTTGLRDGADCQF